MELQSALAYARRRRMGPFRPVGAAPDRHKEMASLARAGFPAEVAARALDTGRAEAEELLAALRQDRTPAEEGGEDAAGDGAGGGE